MILILGVVGILGGRGQGGVGGGVGGGCPHHGGGRVHLHEVGGHHDSHGQPQSG